MEELMIGVIYRLVLKLQLKEKENRNISELTYLRGVSCLKKNGNLNIPEVVHLGRIYRSLFIKNYNSDFLKVYQNKMRQNNRCDNSYSSI